MAARPTKDGLSSTAFPSGVRNIPVEVVEAGSPLLFRRRELLPELGGIGTFRGGHSHVAEIFNTEPAAFAVSAGTWDRLRNPTRGREGGGSGRAGRVQLSSGREAHDEVSSHGTCGRQPDCRVAWRSRLWRPVATRSEFGCGRSLERTVVRRDRTKRIWRRLFRVGRARWGSDGGPKGDRGDYKVFGICVKPYSIKGRLQFGHAVEELTGNFRTYGG